MVVLTRTSGDVRYAPSYGKCCVKICDLLLQWSSNFGGWDGWEILWVLVWSNFKDCSKAHHCLPSQFPDILAFEPAAALGYSKEKPSPRQKLEGPYTILQYSDFGFHISFSQPVVWVPDVKESRVCWASNNRRRQGEYPGPGYSRFLLVI